jgi:hypothetical protein
MPVNKTRPEFYDNGKDGIPTWLRDKIMRDEEAMPSLPDEERAPWAPRRKETEREAGIKSK